MAKTAAEAIAEMVGVEPSHIEMKPIPDYQSGMSEECKVWVEATKKAKAEADMGNIKKADKIMEDYFNEIKKDKEQEEIMAHFKERGDKCLTMKMKALAQKK